MSAPTEAEDTARRRLLQLANRQLTFPHMDVSDELALAARMQNPAARERAFGDLCEAVRVHDTAWSEGVLDLLTGGAA